MHILYISYDGMTDPLGQSQVLPYLIELSKKGVAYTLVSFEKDERFKKYQSDISDICMKSNINWVPIKYTKRPPIISTIWDVWKLRLRCRQIIKDYKISVVHCRSYITSLVGLHLKRTYGIKFIFDMRGFWADERVDGGLWNLNHSHYKIIYNYFKQREKEFIEESDAIVSLTEAGKIEMKTWGVSTSAFNKITVTPCSTDYTHFSLVNKELRKTAKQELGLKQDQIVVSYIGSIGTWYLLKEMLLLFKCIMEKYPSAVFLFLTPDAKQLISNEALNTGIPSDNILVMFKPRAELVNAAHASDVSIFFIKNSYSKKSSSPTKLGELLAMGIPVICNNGVGDVREIVKQTQSGLCIADFDTANFKKAANQVEQLTKINPAEIRTRSKSIFDLELGIDKYYKIYNKLLCNG